MVQGYPTFCCEDRQKSQISLKKLDKDRPILATDVAWK